MAQHRTLVIASTVTGVCLTFLLAASCGGGRDSDDGPPAVPDTSEQPWNPELPPPPTALGTDCPTLGVVKECTVPLPEVNGVKSCFIGLQVCEVTDEDTGGWSECADAETIAAKLEEMEASGVLVADGTPSGT